MTNTVSRIISDETLNRIIQIESAGRPNAKAGTSSATGLFQFINSTWLNVVKKYRPDLMSGRSRTQILNLRTNPSLSIQLGARYTEEDAKALGFGYQDGDLYLAHFLGVTTARKFLRARANARADKLASKAAVRANKSILANKTIGQVRAWAENSMQSRWNRAGRVDWISKWYDPNDPLVADTAVVSANEIPDEIPDEAVAAKVEEFGTGPTEVSAQSKQPSTGKDSRVYDVQNRLHAMKYNPGMVDGLWGGNTAGAIAGFLNDRHSTISVPTSFDDFVRVYNGLTEELVQAEFEGFSRPVSPVRKFADEKVVEERAPEAKPVKRNFFVTIWGAISAFFIAFFDALKDNIESAANYFSDSTVLGYVVKFWSVLVGLPGWVWFLTAGGILVFIASQAHDGLKKITESVKTGERL